MAEENTSLIRGNLPVHPEEGSLTRRVHAIADEAMFNHELQSVLERELACKVSLDWGVEEVALNERNPGVAGIFIGEGDMEANKYKRRTWLFASIITPSVIQRVFGCWAINKACDDMTPGTCAALVYKGTVHLEDGNTVKSIKVQTFTPEHDTERIAAAKRTREQYLTAQAKRKGKKQ